MNRRAHQILIVAVMAIAPVVVARTGQAAERGSKKTAEAHYQKGMKAYTLGRFEDAIEEFEKAYELRQEPIFLYNIAQSHRQNSNPQRAVFFYRRYLEAEPGAKNRADIEKRIKDLEASASPRTEPAALTPPPTTSPAIPPASAPPQPAEPPPTVVEPPPLAPVQAQATPQPSAGRGLRIAGIAVGAVGLAGAATGVFLVLHANSLHDEAVKGVYDDGKYQDAKTFRTLGWVSLGVGAAAVATGGVLYYLGYSAKRAQSVALVPTVGAGAAGALLCGRF